MREVTELIGEEVCLSIGPSQGAVRVDVEIWDIPGHPEREHRSVLLDSRDVDVLVRKLRGAKLRAIRQAQGKELKT